jgi:hypothetical protein
MSEEQWHGIVCRSIFLWNFKLNLTDKMASNNNLVVVVAYVYAMDYMVEGIHFHFR